MTREQAYAVWEKYNTSDALRKHAHAVEAVMRRFADKYGEDPEYWGMVGFLHDVDYEQYPEEHCKKAVELLSENGFDADFIHAVCSHGWGMCCDVEPVKTMEKVLYTVDELTGLINAAALMRPNRSVMDMEVKSVKKKFKAPSFAAGVNRQVILQGCEMLGLPLEEVMELAILGMRDQAERIGLAGTEE